MTTMALSQLGMYALEYTGIGLYVLPLWGVKDGVCLCNQGSICGVNTGKHPLGKLAQHGAKDASRDPDTIRRWWDEYPDANIGIACGPSGLLVVDIDPRNGGDEAWESLVSTYRDLPETSEAETGGGGNHLVFRRPPGVPARDSKLRPGIDIKSYGYIVAVPSVHRSKREYVWLADADPTHGAPFADPPRWLINEIQKNANGSSESSDIERLKFNPDANPPPKFWDALDSDEHLQRIWSRTRRPKNQKDKTPSAWAMSLWKRLLAHHLTQRDVMDVLVAYRAKHHDNRRPPIWYQKEAAKYASELNNPPATRRIDEPPVALQRVSPGTRRSLEFVEQALRHAEAIHRERVPIASGYLLVRLARYADGHGRANPSQARLAAEMNARPEYVSRLLKHLGKMGCVVKTDHSGPGKSNVWDVRVFEPHPHQHMNKGSSDAM